MCEPTTIAYTVAAVASAYSGIQSYQSGQRQAEAAEASAAYNARLSENEAVKTRQKGNEEEIALRNRTAQLKARQRSQLAASGVDVDFGTAADLQEDTDILGEADALRVRRNYEDQALALESQAELGTFQGDAAAANARAQGTAGLVSGIRGAAGAGASAYSAHNTSLLSGGTPVNSKWYGHNSSYRGR